MTRHTSTATARSLQTEASASIQAAGKPAASSKYPNPQGGADRIFKLPEPCPKGWLTKMSKCSTSVPAYHRSSSKQQLSSGVWAIPKEASKMPSALEQIPGCLMVLGQGLVFPKLQRGPSSHRAATSCPNPVTLQCGQPGARGNQAPAASAPLAGKSCGARAALTGQGKHKTTTAQPGMSCQGAAAFPECPRHSTPLPASSAGGSRALLFAEKSPELLRAAGRGMFSERARMTLVLEKLKRT